MLANFILFVCFKFILFMAKELSSNLDSFGRTLSYRSVVVIFSRYLFHSFPLHADSEKFIGFYFCVLLMATFLLHHANQLTTCVNLRACASLSNSRSCVFLLSIVPVLSTIFVHVLLPLVSIFLIFTHICNYPILRRPFQLAIYSTHKKYISHIAIKAS